MTNSYEDLKALEMLIERFRDAGKSSELLGGKNALATAVEKIFTTKSWHLHVRSMLEVAHENTSPLKKSKEGELILEPLEPTKYDLGLSYLRLQQFRDQPRKVNPRIYLGFLVTVYSDLQGFERTLDPDGVVIVNLAKQEIHFPNGETREIKKGAPKMVLELFKHRASKTMTLKQVLEALNEGESGYYTGKKVRKSMRDFNREARKRKQIEADIFLCQKNGSEYEIHLKNEIEFSS